MVRDGGVGIPNVSDYQLCYHALSSHFFNWVFYKAKYVCFVLTQNSVSLLIYIKYVLFLIIFPATLLVNHEACRIICNSNFLTLHSEERSIIKKAKHGII